MRLLHLSTYDVHGGAAIAAHRLHLALRDIGEDSTMLVQCRLGKGPGVSGAPGLVGLVHTGLRLRLDRFPATRRHASSHFSPAWLPGNIVARVRRLKPDLVHLHWTCNGLLRIEDMPRLGAPVVWTMHDAWAFTGGCHYPGACERFMAQCGNCPLLGEGRENDLSRRIWERKRRAYAATDLRLVAPSRWLADLAGKSGLLAGRPVKVIPNGLDVGHFAPRPKAASRQALGLPEESAVVLFSAMRAARDPRKGYAHLVSALEQLPQLLPGRELRLAVLGADRLPSESRCGVRAIALGHVRDQEVLAAAYSAADVLAVPSLEDNLPNTVMEAMACGTPVAAFAVGGVPEMVDHGQSGRLAEPADRDGLARGMAWILEDARRLEQLSASARQTAMMRFDARGAAARYAALYADVVSRGDVRHGPPAGTSMGTGYGQHPNELLKQKGK